jgi:hypothetical protein
MNLFDSRVRGYVYDMVLRGGEVPSINEVAREVGASPNEVRAAFERLAAARVLVIHPETGGIVMAAPFSAVPTQFRVSVPPRNFHANCIWDALGVAAMLKKDARIETSCGDCGRPEALDVRDGNPHGEGLLHFAVPAKQWWNDIVFT